ncbi:fas apoptotic inhibitory molecule 1-like isoform X1 [Antedon mediterranea]|uniref:fas apoptotic inhibitory molecule 1-like isoform X1 n=1 Tax=Antedon mediterranea TaxID=105859 RepID=UPI003AF42CA4
MSDIVAQWDVSLSDGIHNVIFEHGTTSGKRVIHLDSKEIFRKNWMFKLVGREVFYIGKHKATVTIEATSGFAYEYSLEVDGKSLKKFTEQRSKTAKCWTLTLDGIDTRIVFEKDTMDVWCNGSKLPTAGEFVDDGTETNFHIRDHSCYVKTVSSFKKKEGILHALFVDDVEIAESTL